jgi:Flp pilus assembly protein CpaB
MASGMPSDQQATVLSSGTVLLGFAAVLTGLGGTYAVRMITNKPLPAEKPVPQALSPKLVTVPLASRDIAAGTTLTIDDVALYKMSPEEVKEYSGGRSFMTNATQIIGKIAAVGIDQGSTFTTQDFYPAGRRPNFAERLKPGLRAVTVTLLSDDALRGFAAPGQSVDVLFHYDASAASRKRDGSTAGDHGMMFGHHDFNPPRRRDYYGNTLGGADGSASTIFGQSVQEATTTLVQGVEVLALGSEAVPTDAALMLPDDESITVTLAVTPRQAELLNVARGHGRLSLTLRGSDDTQFVKLVDPVTIDQIMNAEHSVHEMEIDRGKQLTRLQFDNGKFLQRRVFDDSQLATGDANHRDASTAPSSSPAATFTMPTFVPMWIPSKAVPFKNGVGVPDHTTPPANGKQSRPTPPATTTAPVTLYDKVMP